MSNDSILYCTLLYYVVLPIIDHHRSSSKSSRFVTHTQKLTRVFPSSFIFLVDYLSSHLVIMSSHPSWPVPAYNSNSNRNGGSNTTSTGGGFGAATSNNTSTNLSAAALGSGGHGGGGGGGGGYSFGTNNANNNANQHHHYHHHQDDDADVAMITSPPPAPAPTATLQHSHQRQQNPTFTVGTNSNYGSNYGTGSSTPMQQQQQMPYGVSSTPMQQQQPVVLFSPAAASNVSGMTTTAYPPPPVETIATVPQQPSLSSMTISPFVPPTWKPDRDLETYLGYLRDPQGYMRLQHDVGTGGMGADMVRQGGLYIKKGIKDIAGCLAQIDLTEDDLDRIYKARKAEFQSARGNLIDQKQGLEEDYRQHIPLEVALSPKLSDITHPSADKALVVAKTTNQMKSGNFPRLHPGEHQGSYQDLCLHAQEVFGIYSVDAIKTMMPAKKGVLNEILVQLAQHGWDQDEDRRNTIRRLEQQDAPRILPKGFRLNIRRDISQNMLVHQLLVALYLQLPGFEEFLQEKDNYKSLGGSKSRS